MKTASGTIFIINTFMEILSGILVLVTGRQKNVRGSTGKRACYKPRFPAPALRSCRRSDKRARDLICVADPTLSGAAAQYLSRGIGQDTAAFLDGDVKWSIQGVAAQKNDFAIGDRRGRSMLTRPEIRLGENCSY